MQTFIFYIITFIIEYFSLSTFLSTPLTRPLFNLILKAQLTHAVGNIAISTQAIGTVVVYHLYNYAWLKIEGGSIPILMVVLLILPTIFLISQELLHKDEVYWTVGKLWGQAVFGLSLIFTSDNLRWIS